MELNESSGREATGNPDCTDKMGNPAWSCIEFDGTGLWCDSCMALAEREAGREAAPECKCWKCPTCVARRLDRYYPPSPPARETS